MGNREKVQQITGSRRTMIFILIIPGLRPTLVAVQPSQIALQLI